MEQPFDRVKNQRRAFIFITYESEDVVEQVVASPKQIVGGREVRSLILSFAIKKNCQLTYTVSKTHTKFEMV